MSDVNEYMTPPPPPSGAPNAEEKQWAMFAHFSVLLGGILGAGWLCFIGPLIIWQVKKDNMPFVVDQAKEALNFSITVTAAFIALWVITFLTIFLASPLTIPLMFLIGLAALVFVVMAGIKANEGVAYRYPFSIRLIK